MPKSRIGPVWCLNFWLPSWFCCWSHGTFRPDASSTRENSKPFKSVLVSYCQIPIQNASHRPPPAQNLLQNLDKLGSGAERFLPYWRNQLLFQIIVSVLMVAAGGQPWQEPLLSLAGPRQTFLKVCFWCDNSALSPLAASLTPPLMKAIADGYHLLVELEDMGPAFQFCVLYWEKGQESRVSSPLDFGMKTEPMCLRAKA